MKRLLVLLAICLLISPLPARAQVQSTLIIGWDGAERHVVYEMLAAGLLPNLATLHVWDSSTSSGATVTKPGWAQILTGYSSAHLGIYGNDSTAAIPKGWTVLEKVQVRYPDVVTWFIAGKGENVGGAPGEPWAITRWQIDYWRNGLRNNNRVGKRALWLLGHYPAPFLGFVEFREPDRTGHRTCGGSAAYRAQLADLDRWLGIMLAALPDNVTVYVLGDHGFNDCPHHDHRGAPESFLATNNETVNRAGDRMDVTPTILAGYGLPVDDLDGRVLTP